MRGFRILTAWALLSLLAAARLVGAVGDVTAVIRADGWSADVTVEGRAAWLGAATLTFGTPGATGTSNLYFAVTSEGYNASGVLGTTARTVYGTALVRMPTGTKEIPGTLSGTFTDGEIISQAVTGAEARVFGASQGTTCAALVAHTFHGNPNASDQWTGGTSGQTCTPSGAPASRTNDERSVNGNIVYRVALSDSVYDDDKNGGAGTSGTNPKLYAAAGWAAQGGNNSSAASNVDCTNSSALDYPVAYGQWDIYTGVLHRSRVKTNYTLAFNATHGHGVACVRFNAVGGTSSVDTEAYVSTQTGTKRPKTNLYFYAFQTSITLSAYTQGETITNRARVYPKVGDANSVMDTSGRTTAANECLGYNEHSLICDKSNLLDVIRYVATTGNDSTGDGSSGNPWLTVSKATTTAGVNVVRLMGTGTTFNLGSTATRRTATEWVVVEADSGATPTVRYSTTRNYRCERLLFNTLPITLVDTASYADGETLNFIAYVGCTFDNPVGNPTAGPGYKSLCTYVINCDGDISRDEWDFGSSASTNHVAYQFDGIAFVADTGTMDGWRRMVACTSSGTMFSYTPSSNPAPAFANFIFGNNRCLNVTSTSANALILGNISISNGWVVGNVIEKTSATSAAVLFYGDSNASYATNLIIEHNTVVGSASPAAGERCNLFYNDRGSYTATFSHIFSRANNWRTNIKSDAFTAPVTLTRVGTTATGTATDHGYSTGDVVTVSGASLSPYNGTFKVTRIDANSYTYVMGSDPGGSSSGACGPHAKRTGNWPILYGVNWRSCNTHSTDGFDFAYGGMDYTQISPVYANFAGEDWGPGTASGLLDRVNYYTSPWAPSIPADSHGRRFSLDATGFASVGADQPQATLTVTYDGDSVSDGGTVTEAAGTKDLRFTAGGLAGAVAYVSSVTLGGSVSGTDGSPYSLVSGGTVSEGVISTTLTAGAGTVDIAWDLSSVFDFDITGQSGAGFFRQRGGKRQRWPRRHLASRSRRAVGAIA